MARRTVYLPEAVEDLVRDAAKEGESFSAALVRLIEAGARAMRARRKPSSIGVGEGPEDLGRRAEYYLRHPVTMRRLEDHR